MTTMILKVVKYPRQDLAFSNCPLVNEKEFPPEKIKHVEVTTGPTRKYVFTLKTYGNNLPPLSMAFTNPMRKWAELFLNQEIQVSPYQFDPNSQLIARIVLEVVFLDNKNVTKEPYNTDEMAVEFLQQFPNQAFTVGQILPFRFKEMKGLMLTVKEMEAARIEHLTGSPETRTPPRTRIGLLLPDSAVIFEKGPNSPYLTLVGNSKGKGFRQSIINLDWNFEKMGIGGLDKEFSTIFRRAFASRVFPPDFIEQLGIKHVRGILLFGPPGTGKTLMARQIGKMLNAREPKVISGPQILDKYVGESEANIRKLFAEAEEEQRRLGMNSGLHLIIFDEIDAICKTRGSVAGNSAVHDTIVNQLLAKIDGVESLNNILVIGMTNKREMIDDALLRPGRLEVQMEIGLPDEYGRVQILNIHTATMRENDKLDPNVDIEELASLTKNFSGAELEGLVRAAQSTAMTRLVKPTSEGVKVDPEAHEKLRVNRDDFLSALENDIKPAYGTSIDTINRLIVQGICHWGPAVSNILEDGDLLIQQTQNSDKMGLVTVLLAGDPNSGKTALAAKIALNSNFPLIKLCTPENMVGFTETAKCNSIKQTFDDAYKSSLSCILVDSLERLLDYGPIGPRYSNLVLQALLVLLKKEPPQGHKLLVICTTSELKILDMMGLQSAFASVLHVPNITKPEHLVAVLEDSDCFTREEVQRIHAKISSFGLSIGIKKLLALIENVRQVAPEAKLDKFLAKLIDEGALFSLPEKY